MSALRIAFILISTCAVSFSLASDYSLPAAAGQNSPLVQVGYDSGTSNAYKKNMSARTAERKKYNDDLDKFEEEINQRSSQDNLIKSFVNSTVQDLKDPDKKSRLLSHIWHWAKPTNYGEQGPFYDKKAGNKYSHANRLFEWNSKDTSLAKLFDEGKLDQKDAHMGTFNPVKLISDLVQFESSFDYFIGLIFGNFPWNSPEVYQANLQDLKTSLSMNMTFSNQVQIANFLRLGLDIEFVPLALELQTEIYSTTALNDNCMMISGQVKALRMDVTLTKNIAKCSNNIHRHFVEAESFTDLLRLLAQKNLFLLFDVECQFDDVEGPSYQHLDMLSFTFWPQANLERTFWGQCGGGIPYISENLSSKDRYFDEDDYDYDRMYQEYN